MGKKAQHHTLCLTPHTLHAQHSFDLTSGCRRVWSNERSEQQRRQLNMHEHAEEP